MSTDINSASPVASWAAADGRAAVTFSALRIEENAGQRAPKRERMYRAGAKIDSTGAAVRGWTVTCSFFNENNEPDVPGTAMYPDQLRALCEALDVPGTGTLTLPTVGPKRAVCDHYTRVEDVQPREYAIVTLVFSEDNEEEQTPSTFDLPTAVASGITTAEQVVEDLAFDGALDDDGMSLLTMLNRLEQLAAAPSDYIADLDEQVNDIRNAISRIELAFRDDSVAFSSSSPPQGGEPFATAPLNRPSSAHTYMLLRRCSDLAARARAGVGARVRIVRFGAYVSLLDVAAAEGASLAAVLALNASFEDPGAIPPGAPIRVPAAA